MIVVRRNGNVSKLKEIRAHANTHHQPSPNTAPISHFALAALAATSVLAAPLPTPSDTADILQPRGFIDDLLQELNPFGKYVDGKTKVKTKDMLENALEVEKQLRGHDKVDESEVKKSMIGFPAH
ncbi:unnamed protein product [Aureobasidium mustum]|uniref:Uncharacterized protein n=1 Tax=Aureobasidium mustum TaxID=2773714 RepID=A0A9N8JY27_9PEZI|nr:unnamed protein product [Aureobasidium mustum]